MIEIDRCTKCGPARFPGSKHKCKKSDMSEEQFSALINYLNSRIELQDNRAIISSRYFYEKCAELKTTALIDAGYDNSESA